MLNTLLCHHIVPFWYISTHKKKKKTFRLQVLKRNSKIFCYSSKFYSLIHTRTLKLQFQHDSEFNKKQEKVIKNKLNKNIKKAIVRTLV